MDIDGLALLDSRAAKAVVTWSRVARSTEPTPGWLRQGDLWLDFDLWCGISGLGARDLLRLVPVLFGAGILDERGADPTALQYARRLVAQRVKKR